MKIRGGDLDLVEYEFSSFKPGEKIRTLGLDKGYVLSPREGTVYVRAPARIHLTVLDMNRFAPARPGGGGLSVRSEWRPRPFRAAARPLPPAESAGPTLHSPSRIRGLGLAPAATLFAASGRGCRP